MKKNKKMLESLNLARDKYLLFSYHNTSADLDVLSHLGQPLIGRNRDETIRYI